MKLTVKNIRGAVLTVHSVSKISCSDGETLHVEGKDENGEPFNVWVNLEYIAKIRSEEDNTRIIQLQETLEESLQARLASVQRCDEALQMVEMLSDMKRELIEFGCEMADAVIEIKKDADIVKVKEELESSVANWNKLMNVLIGGCTRESQGLCDS